MAGDASCTFCMPDTDLLGTDVEQVARSLFALPPAFFGANSSSHDCSAPDNTTCTVVFESWQRIVAGQLIRSRYEKLHQADTAHSLEDETRNGERNANRNPE